MKSLRSIAAVAVLSLALAGCAKVAAPGAPATPTDPYNKAAVAMSNFATDLNSAQQIEITLHKAGIIDAATHTTVQQAFLAIDKIGPQIDAGILAQSSSDTLRTKVNAALDALASITVATGKLDASAVAQLTNAVAAIKLLLGGVLDALPNQLSEVSPNGSIDYRSTGRAGDLAWPASVQTDRSRSRSGGYSGASFGRYSGPGRRNIPAWTEGSRSRVGYFLAA